MLSDRGSFITILWLHHSILSIFINDALRDKVHHRVIRVVLLRCFIEDLAFLGRQDFLLGRETIRVISCMIC